VVGLETPKPVPVMRADHQVAQKLHAVSGEGSERARDLVDLQLIDRGEDLDLSQVRATCARLFEYRRQQPWLPTVAVGEGWGTLYEAAIEDVQALPDVEAAVAWVNAFVERIEAAGS
ncbi:MAG: nucleotidyl transferase AbiEii/AbiGii toxin family protein, partial [Nocardioidaceae bacterium]